MILTFWILLFIIFYAYVGYTLILLFLRIFIRDKKRSISDNQLPEITLLIAAYNEKDFVHQKVKNTNELDYPIGKINVMWITDGSNDGTPDILKQYKDISVLHEDERKGKTAAINRAMKQIATPITIFSDANTLLNKEAIKEIVSPFEDDKTGCVAGEKRIINKKHDSATGSGEGTYWQYESLIKTSESIVGSTMGAVGELFALRTKLFVPVPDNSIIDDFVISLTIALKGYKIGYAPNACASETATASIKDELKRKVRIASGGFQTMAQLPQLLNILKNGMLSFQFFSHKVLRWLIVPFSFPLLFICNAIIVYVAPTWNNFYSYFMLFQLTGYFFVLLGGLLKNKNIRFKALFLPYYLMVMNYAQIAGLFRFIKGKHSVIWEKVNRQELKS